MLIKYGPLECEGAKGLVGTLNLDKLCISFAYD
jgi:hypothetical protein